jgi:hypothetical protein
MESGSGSRSSISNEAESGYGSRVLMAENLRKKTDFFPSFLSKIAIYLSPILHKGVQATRKAFSLQKITFST